MLFSRDGGRRIKRDSIRDSKKEVKGDQNKIKKNVLDRDGRRQKITTG